MSNVFSFMLFIGLAWAIMFFVHLVAFLPIARVWKISIPHQSLVLAVLSFSYFLASIGVRTVGGKLADVFYFIAATWLGVVFLLFSFMMIYQLVHLVTGFDSRVLVGGLIALVSCLSVYALWAGHALVTRSYTVTIEGLDKPFRLVHLSDIHIGTVHQTEYLKRVVEATNTAKPDLVLITGDLFDGSAPVVPEMLIALDDLNAPSYFSNGNHEEYEGLAGVRETLQNLKLQLLENEKIDWNGIEIIGVNDRQSLRGTSLEQVLETIAPDYTKPTILMYHSPSDWGMVREKGIDLMLSGHTHNGQIYPFNLLVRLSFKYVQGLFEEGGKYLHVTPGTGTWGPPMRLGSRNQVTIIDLVPKEKVDTVSEETFADAETLDLSGRELTQVPEYIFNETNTEVLDLSGNKLRGSLPAEIRHLQNLKVLDLSNNQFTGVPAEIGQLKKIEILNLANNDITGLPLELANLMKIKIIDLRGNDYSKIDLEIIKKGLSSETIIKVD